MDIISTLCVAPPSGMWARLINWFFGGIGNFGWTILIVTIIVKLIVSPLEFLVKYNSKKQSLIQQKCAPQIAKIQKKFGKDQQTIKIQTQSLYKREGLNAGAGCIIMLVNLVVTLVIFFSFFSALRKNSAYEAINQYEILEEVYSTENKSLIQENGSNIKYYSGNPVVDEITTNEFISEFNDAIKVNELDKQIKALDAEANAQEIESLNAQIDEIVNKYNDEESENPRSKEYFTTLYAENIDLIKSIYEDSANKVVVKWNEIKSDWLWVENIWVQDALIYPFPTYENLVKMAKSGGYEDYVSNNLKQENYTEIASIVNSKGGRTNNGYYILAVLSALITFLSQYISELNNNLKNKKAKQLAKDSMSESMQTTSKFMKLFMPLLMVVFVLQSSASFGIYIIASNVVAIGVGQLEAFIINKITHKKQLEVEAVLEKEADRLIRKGKLQEKK